MLNPHDNYFVSRHEKVAENYGRTILAWIREQPETIDVNLNESQTELGLDDIQFEMGMNWCRRHGYISPFDILFTENLERPRFPPRPRFASRPPGFQFSEGDDEEYDEDDLDDEDSDPDRPRLRMFDEDDDDFSLEKSRLELKFLDREFKFALLMLAYAAILTMLIAEQFRSLSDADRSALVICIFLGLIGSGFLIAGLIMKRPLSRGK